MWGSGFLAHFNVKRGEYFQDVEYDFLQKINVKLGKHFQHVGNMTFREIPNVQRDEYFQNVEIWIFLENCQRETW